MFRQMRRVKQQLGAEECARLLRRCPRGVLSVIGDDGYPYGVPMDHWYSEAENKLYFHCAREGHKLDAIAAYDKVSYCVIDEGTRAEGEWALVFGSVIAFGRMRVVTEEQKKLEICSNLVRKFTDDEAYLRRELENAFARVCCLELEIEHMTGKRVKES